LVKLLRIDNGLEFYSGEFDEFCKNKEITRHHTLRNTPQQNNIIEYMNKILLKIACCMLSQARLSMGF
jgi:transposase InsO family protein